MSMSGVLLESRLRVARQLCHGPGATHQKTMRPRVEGWNKVMLHCRGGRAFHSPLISPQAHEEEGEGDGVAVMLLRCGVGQLRV